MKENIFFSIRSSFLFSKNYFFKKNTITEIEREKNTKLNKNTDKKRRLTKNRFEKNVSL